MERERSTPFGETQFIVAGTPPTLATVEKLNGAPDEKGRVGDATRIRCVDPDSVREKGVESKGGGDAAAVRAARAAGEDKTTEGDSQGEELELLLPSPTESSGSTTSTPPPHADRTTPGLSSSRMSYARGSAGGRRRREVDTECEGG